MNFFLRSLLFSLLLFTFIQVSAQTPGAIINEWSQGRNNTTGEWVEILIVEESQDFTLGGWYLTDGGNTALFKFANNFPKLPKGTILLVYMNPASCRDSQANAPCKYPDDYHPNMPLVTEIHACDLVVDPNNPKYINTAVTIWASGNNSSNTDNNDNYRLFDAFNNLVHDWDNDNNPALIAKRPRAGQAVYFKGGNLNNLENEIYDPALWENVPWNSNLLTPGKPNGGANTALVNLLKNNSLSHVRFADLTPITRPEGTRTKITFYLCNARGNESIDLDLADPESPFTAVYGTDYYTVPPAVNNIVELRFQPGKDTVSFDVVTKSDCETESDKFFFIRLSSTSAFFEEEKVRFTITDVAPQNLSFSLNPTGNITACSGNTLPQNFEVRQLNGNPLPDPNLFTYQWQEASNRTQGLSSTTVYNPSFTPTVTGTYTFTVIVTDKATQCSTEVKEIIVTVIDQPKVTIQISPEKANDQYCEGEQITLIAKVEPDNLQNLLYGWNLNLPSQSSVNYTITRADALSGRIEFTLTISVNGSCPAYTSKTIQVGRNPYFTYDPVTMTICKGAEGKVLTISNINPANADIIFIPNTGVTRLPDQNGNHQYQINPATSQIYQIVAKDPATGCTSELGNNPLTVTVDQNDPVIIVQPLDGVAFNARNEYCEGTRVNLIVKNRNGTDLSPGTTYLWSNGNTTAEITGLVLSPNMSDYSVQVTVPGCPGVMAEPNPVVFVVNPLPVLLNPPPIPLTVCVSNRYEEYKFNFQDASTILQASGWNPPNTVEVIGDPKDHIYRFPAVTGQYTATFELNGCTLPVIVNIEAINERAILVNGVVADNNTPKIITLCKGDQVAAELTLSGGAVPAEPFTWIPDNITSMDYVDLSASAQNNKAIFSAPLAGTVTYTVTTKDASGCPVKQAVIQLNAGVMPEVNPEIDEPKPVYCHNEVVKLKASCGSCPNGIEWSSPDFPTFTSNSPTPQTPELPNTGTAPKTYTFILKGTSADGCTEEKSVTVTIQPQPQINVQTNMPNNETAFCEGGNMRLTITVTPSGNYSYSWGAVPQGIIVTNNELAAANFSQALAGTFTVTVTDANSCTNSANITVSVKSPSPVQINVANNGTICEGETLTLTASPSNFSNYQWFKGGSAISGATSATFTQANVTIADQGSYSVSATDAGGCPTTASAVSITVNPRPIIPANVLSAKAICEGDKVTITGGNYTFTPMTGVIMVNATTYDLAPAATTTYTLVLTDANGCKSESKTLTITVNRLPKVERFDNKNGCAGQSITLKVRGADTYQWLPNPEAGTLASTADSIVFTPANPGNYTFTVIGTNTATNCVSVAQNNITLTVNELPILERVIAGRIKITSGDTTRLFVTSTNGTELIWSPNDNLTQTPDMKEVIVAPKTTTEYSVKAIRNGCESAPQTVRVEVEPYEFEISTVFTPNDDGINDVLRYSFDNINVRSFQIIILDRWGQKVFESNNLTDFWNGKVNNTGEKVPAGTYVMAMKITRNDGKTLEKNQIITLIR
jgi:gliding motility-associated-like protein